jgi:hypothetical protein
MLTSRVTPCYILFILCVSNEPTEGLHRVTVYIHACNKHHLLLLGFLLLLTIGETIGFLLLLTIGEKPIGFLLLLTIGETIGFLLLLTIGETPILFFPTSPA